MHHLQAVVESWTLIPSGEGIMSAIWPRELLIGAVLLLGACTTPASEAVIDSDAAATLDGVLREGVEAGAVPGVVALVTSGDSVLYRSAFGVMDAEGAVPMREDAIFVIASMTKPITSVAAMTLVEEGLVGLDEPASAYLPELANRRVLVEVDAADSTVTTRPATRPVTVRDLLRHTSGLGYTFSSPELLEWTQITGNPALDQPLLHDPGQRWTYGSNTYFVGRIIEEVSGMGLAEFFRTRVLVPLGMEDTSFDLPVEDRNRRASLYRRTDDGLQGQPPSWPDEPQVRGDYGLRSTADDYGRFLRLILGEGETEGHRLLSRETMAELTRNQLEDITVVEQPSTNKSLSRPFPLGADRDGFSLGFQIASDEGARGRAPGSLSWAGLYNTHFWIDPASDVGVVLLTQLLPFYDERAIELLSAFEDALYQELSSGG